MPSIAAVTASAFILMKSVRVLSRSKMMARTKPPRCLFGRDADSSSQADLAVVDANVEPAVGIAADPRLVGDRGPIPTVVGQGEQHSVTALPAIGKALLHPVPPPLPGHAPGFAAASARGHSRRAPPRGVNRSSRPRAKRRG